MKNLNIRNTVEKKESSLNSNLIQLPKIELSISVQWDDEFKHINLKNFIKGLKKPEKLI